METRKSKSASKTVLSDGPKLTQKKLSTMKSIADIVGGTLGPGGRPAILERPEHDMPPLVTKDGVTVFKSLGYHDPVSQVILEASRDAAIKTANSAGDGTTTATILAEALVRGVHEYCGANPKVSPQRVIRDLYRDYERILLPRLESKIIKPGSCDFENPEDPAYKVYKGVATVSANGDTELAQAVMDCYGLVGDYGNVTILEASGDNKYEVESMDGYFLGCGYQDLGQFYPAFINNAARQTSSLTKPKFLLYYGQINHLNSLFQAMNELAADFDLRNQTGQSRWENHDVVVVATGFSEQVKGTMAAGFQESSVMNMYPLVIPKLPMQNGQLQFLQDLSAITGAKIFDPINNPLDTCTTEDLGPGVESFEAHGFKSSIVGFAQGIEHEEAILRQAAAIRTQLANPESQLEQIWLQERLAKITNGIAKLIVRGSSTVEIRERKDRAEDAVCAVKGAIQHGVFYGGATALRDLSSWAKEKCESEASRIIFYNAFREPFKRLLSNSGLNPDEVAEIDTTLSFHSAPAVYDAMHHKIVDPGDVHLYDSAQAVKEAVKNSLSIASVIGTMGGVVVFERDDELERMEAKEHHTSYREMQEYKG